MRTVPGNWLGDPLLAGKPDYTDDQRFWDGTTLYRCTNANVRKRHGHLLGEADVVMLNPTDCCPGHPHCGSKTLVGTEARRRLTGFGVVRFRDREGHLQRWEAEDGTVLALLVGDVDRPPLP